jgi:hypothetical protein
MQDDYPWSSMYECWTDAGVFNIADGECEADLIAEVYISDTPPAVKETEAELRDMLVPSGPLTAMPIMRPVSGPNGPLMEVHDRKTLRDEFAMEAMKKMMDMSGLDAGAHHEESNRAALAKLSYGIATAMMEAREK